MRFEVVEHWRPFDLRTIYVVVDRGDRDAPVARFDEREAADAHARRLNAGPLEWEDEKDDEWGDWAKWDD